MNLKNVLKTYSLLRSLSDDESALLETLRGLNDSEREQLVETMTPTKGTGKGIKKTRKPRAKSAHQQSLSSAIQRVGKGKGKVDDGPDLGLPCAHILPDDNHCMEMEDNPVHDPKGGYVTSHEFVPPARSAGGRSSANGAAGSTTANFEVEKESVSTATGG